MNYFLRRVLAGIAFMGLASAQSIETELQDAISKYPTLSLFHSLLVASPDTLSNVLSKQTTNITILIPTNRAINNYLSKSTVRDITKLSTADIQTLFSYLAIPAALQRPDFTDPRGTVVPTFLKGAEFNNRSAGEALESQYGDGATGQVVFASKENTGQGEASGPLSGPTVTLRGGLAQDVQMIVVDGKWGPDNVNSFQVVNEVLTPPRNCSTTVRSVGGDSLTALDEALKRAKLWPVIDTSFNLTCLGPSTDAFEKAGNPQESLPQSELADVILAHTLNQVTYTNFLQDGNVFNTLNGTKVRVRVKGTEIYFNNAKVIEPNVLTNNGLIHVLDSVIVAENEETTSGSSSGNTPSSTSSGTGTRTSSAAATSTSSNTSTGTATSAGTASSTGTTTSGAAATSTGAGSHLSVGNSGLIALIAGIMVV